MKGPLGRLQLRVRREWRCPVCDRREFTGGQVVNLRCDCLAHNDPPRTTWMMLIEPPRRPRPRKPQQPPPEAPAAPGPMFGSEEGADDAHAADGGPAG